MAQPAGFARVATLVAGFAAGALAVQALGGGVGGARQVIVSLDAGPAPLASPAATTDTAAPPQASGDTSVAPAGTTPAPSGPAGPSAVNAPTPATGGATTESTTGGPSGDPAPATDDPVEPEAPPVRGVSADLVRVGVAVLDIGALRHLGPDFNIGDGQQQMEAWLRGVRRDGLLPVHGRDLEFVYRRHEPTAINAASQRASCQAFLTDERVFTVIASSEYPVGAECVAREYRTPIVATNGVLDETYARSEPYLHTVQVGLNRMVRNWVRWAHEQGLLEGRTIGLYRAASGSDGAQQQAMRDGALVPALAELGQHVAVEHATDQPLGGPQDSVAAHRFRTEGVDLALLWTSKTGFMQQADAQGYKPTYIEFDYKGGTSDAQSNRHPPSQFHGTLAMTASRYGEGSSGVPPNERARACARYFEEHTGRSPDRASVEFGAMNGMCDLGWILLEALTHAGPALTHDTVVSGLHAIDGFELGGHFQVSFGPGKYDGTDQQRTLEWTQDCTCWKVLTPPGPLWVR